MGYNTIAFMLNDMMHELRKSPNAVAFGLTYPPMSEDSVSLARWKESVASVAKEHNEPRVHGQALEVLPTFHASETRFYRAGGNCILQLKVIKFGKTKDGKKTVTLEMP